MVATRVVDIPTKLPLFATMNNRQTPILGTLEVIEKDARLINAFLDKDEATGDVWIVKRPGLALKTPASATVIAGNGFGAYTSSNRWAVFYINNGATVRLYRYLGGGSVYLGDGWVPTSLPACAYSSEIRNAAEETVILITVPGEMWTINTATGAVVQVSPVVYPPFACKGVAVLDTIAYIITDNGAIYGSMEKDPFTWDPANLIQANTEGDEGVTIRKHLTYVIAFKRYSTEVFYDAGAAPGSALAPVDAAYIPVGCSSVEGVQSVSDDTLIWVTYDRKGKSTVAKLKGLSYSTVSTPAVERLLNKDGSVLYSFTTVIAGHTFYVMRYQHTPYGTLAYDIDYDQWYFWSDVAGKPWAYVAQCSFGSDNQLLQHRTLGFLYAFSTEYFRDTFDSGSSADPLTPVPMDIYTPNFDAGVDRRKQLTTMSFRTDQVLGSMLKIRCNDSDYAPDRWTNFREVDLGLLRPILTRCGTFYRRAYNFRHDLPKTFRIRQVDLQMDLGTI